MHLTGSDTEAHDIYQEAFLKAYKNVGSFRLRVFVYTWIYRIVTNLCSITCGRSKCEKKMRRRDSMRKASSTMCWSVCLMGGLPPIPSVIYCAGN